MRAGGCTADSNTPSQQPECLEDYLVVASGGLREVTVLIFVAHEEAMLAPLLYRSKEMRFFVPEWHPLSTRCEIHLECNAMAWDRMEWANGTALSCLRVSVYHQ